jgi:hypothetical protein
MKILIVFKNPKVDSPDACHHGLGITALNTALSLREHRIEADAFPVANGEYLWAQLAGEWSKYTHVVLEAPFIDAPYLERLFKAFPDKHFTLVYHSNLGFLAQDQFAGTSIPKFLELQKSGNFTLAGNSHELARGIQSASGQPFAWLPNIYHLPSQVKRQRERWRHGMTLNMGLFGAARVLKNWPTAVVGAMIVARRLGTQVNLHVNTGRDEGAAATRNNVDALLTLNPLVNLVEVPWLSHDDFMRYLHSHIDISLQPSFTETFNNVIADGCAAGVPGVVSPSIHWVPKSWMCQPDSAVSIADVTCRVLEDRDAVAEGWAALDNYNQAAIKAWMQWLTA